MRKLWSTNNFYITFITTFLYQRYLRTISDRLLPGCSRVKRLKGTTALLKSKAESLVEKDEAKPSKADNSEFTKPNSFHVHCTAAARPTPETLTSKPRTGKLDGRTH